jgi:hypothetical protein
MLDGYDDYYDTELEDILTDELDCSDLDNLDVAQREIDLAIRKENGDLYVEPDDSYLEQIEKARGSFRDDVNLDNHDYLLDEIERSVARIRQKRR